MAKKKKSILENLLKSFLSTTMPAAPILTDISERMSGLFGGVLKAGKEQQTGTFKAPKTGIKIPLKKIRSQAIEPDIGQLIPPQLVGAVRGVRGKQTVMEELPKALGIDPKSAGGLALGFGGEVLTPDPLDIIAASKLVKGGKKALGEVAAKGTKELGEGLIEKSIRASKSQAKNFFKQTGETIGKFITRNKLTGNVAEKTQEAINIFQGQFDDIAINSGVKIGLPEIQIAIQKAISELDPTANKTQIKVLKELGDDIIVRITEFGGEINVGDLTTTRKAFDKLIPSGSFNKLLGGEPVSQNILKRTFIQDVIREVTSNIKIGGKSLKNLGQEISKLKKLQKIVSDQSFLGKGSKLVGLTDLLASGAGIAAGGIPGGVGAVALNKLLSSPKVLQETGKVVSKLPENKLLQLLLKGGGKIAKEAVMQTGEAIGNMPIQQQIQAQQPQQAQQPVNQQELPPFQPYVTPQTGGGAGVAPETGGITEDKLLQIILHPEISSSTKTQLMSFYKLQQKEKEGTKTRELEAVNQLESLYGVDTDQSLSIGKTRTGLGKLASDTERRLKIQTDPQYAERLQKYKQVLPFALAILNKARQAGTLNKGEYEQLIQSVPNEFTSEAVAKDWFASVRNILKIKDTQSTNDETSLLQQQGINL